jgi:D-alanyl-lipoteichoic acid acyltransferase DltB (MBOAT superfamily)
MDTGSLQFVAFGLAAALLVNLSRRPLWRSTVLLAASFLFIGLIDRSVTALLPLAAFLLLGYLSVRLLQSGRPKLMVLCVITVILAYAWLKKYTFLPHATFLNHPYLVLGISYIFFRVLHLIIETGEGSELRPISLFAYLTYTLNFTTFVCGPIQRYDDFARDQFALQPLPLGPRVLGTQLERILRGFVKINILAMFLYSAQQDALAALAQPLPLVAKLFAAFRLAVLYPFFLYCNFSGYIDIVIALARIMRLRLPENFNRPFSATSFIDFWSRWHITLSLWLKTYVYNPLLMALMRRNSSPRLMPYLGVFSFFVTFFLVGIWHGRTSEFVIFGVLQGGGVAANKLWQVWLTGAMGKQRYKALNVSLIYNSFSRGLTFTWFAFTLFWFWASWKQLQSVFTSIATTQWIAVWLAIWIAATAALATWELLRSLLLLPKTADGPLLESRYARVIYASAFALVAFVLTVLLNHPAPDLVYKAF